MRKGGVWPWGLWRVVLGRGLGTWEPEVSCAVARSPALRGTLCLVECSADTLQILNFIFECIFLSEAP